MALNRGVLDLFINQTACLSRAERFNSGLKASKSSMRAGKTPWAFLLLTTASQVVDLIPDLHAFSALFLHCIVRRIETVCEWPSWTVIYSSLTDHWVRSICHSHHLFLPKFFPHVRGITYMSLVRSRGSQCSSETSITVVSVVSPAREAHERGTESAFYFCPHQRNYILQLTDHLSSNYSLSLLLLFSVHWWSFQAQVEAVHSSPHHLQTEHPR